MNLKRRLCCQALITMSRQYDAYAVSCGVWSSSPNATPQTIQIGGFAVIYVLLQKSTQQNELLMVFSFFNMPKRILCSYGVDIDAVAGWLGSYGGQDSPNDISRGLFAGTHGTRRMLRLFEKYNIKATWFIPGHTLETFPEECAMVRDAGHEIGLHGMMITLHKFYRLLTSELHRILT